MKPKILTDFSWFDFADAEVILSVTDKTTMTFNLEEFSELYRILTNTRTQLLEMSEISCGVVQNGELSYEELIYIPSDEEYN
jgi:hypothetical protein